MEPVAIIGAGPAGLATAACLKRVAVPFALLDRSGQVGGAFRWVQPTMKVLSPRRYINLPLLSYPGRETYPTMGDYARYLERYADAFGLKPEQRNVTSVRRTANGFDVRCGATPAIHCSLGVVATGLFSDPVWPEIKGLLRNPPLREPLTQAVFEETTPTRLARGNGPRPTIMHACDWQGPEAFAGQRILIIGAGVSGVGIAEECARDGLQVMVSHRARLRIVPPRLLGLDILHWFRPVEKLPRGFFRLLCRDGVHPPAYDNGYSTFVADGSILEIPEVTQISGKRFECADGNWRETDVIVAATGYRYSAPFLPPEIRRMPGGHPMTRACESSDLPGLFFVGAPCSRRLDSEFLRGIARDAVHVASCIKRRLAY